MKKTIEEKLNEVLARQIRTRADIIGRDAAAEVLNDLLKSEVKTKTKTKHEVEDMTA